mmetsp:Transcript_6657/g.15954  ORF Transcript_6657/g.15954 Transcript_6657/m.15954 type:complete len:713 (+) Transcript_6657:109-2247(+)
MGASIAGGLLGEDLDFDHVTCSAAMLEKIAGKPGAACGMAWAEVRALEGSDSSLGLVNRRAVWTVTCRLFSNLGLNVTGQVYNKFLLYDWGIFGWDYTVFEQYWNEVVPITLELVKARPLTIIPLPGTESKVKFMDRPYSTAAIDASIHSTWADNLPDPPKRRTGSIEEILAPHPEHEEAVTWEVVINSQDPLALEYHPRGPHDPLVIYHVGLGSGLDAGLVPGDRVRMINGQDPTEVPPFHLASSLNQRPLFLLVQRVVPLSMKASFVGSRVVIGPPLDNSRTPSRPSTISSDAADVMRGVVPHPPTPPPELAEVDGVLYDAGPVREEEDPNGGFPVGTRVQVDGRAGVVSWNGLPGEFAARVVWDDTLLESDVVELSRLEVVEREVRSARSNSSLGYPGMPIQLTGAHAATLPARPAVPGLDLAALQQDPSAPRVAPSLTMPLQQQIQQAEPVLPTLPGRRLAPGIPTASEPTQDSVASERLVRLFGTTEAPVNRDTFARPPVVGGATAPPAIGAIWLEDEGGVSPRDPNDVDSPDTYPSSDDFLSPDVMSVLGSHAQVQWRILEALRRLLENEETVDSVGFMVGGLPFHLQAAFEEDDFLYLYLFNHSKRSVHVRYGWTLGQSVVQRIALRECELGPKGTGAEGLGVLVAASIKEWGPRINMLEQLQAIEHLVDDDDTLTVVLEFSVADSASQMPDWAEGDVGRIALES